MQKFIVIIIVLLLSLTACGRRDKEQAEEAAKAQPEVIEAQSQGATQKDEEKVKLPTPQVEEKVETPTSQAEEKVATETPQSQPITGGEDTSPVPKPLTELRNGSPVSTPLPGQGPAILPAGTEELVDTAKKMLAETSTVQVTADEIKVVSLEPVEWRDTSLGCPQEGMAYAQVITPGYVIVLEAGGQTYEFHTNTTNQVVPCFKEGQ
jgi:hypothetical protein